MSTLEPPTVHAWAWLQDTYWYVPEANLLAFRFDAETRELQPVQDQTVYHITGFRDGYFWGRTAVQMGDGPRTCLSLVGSVTPEGRVLLTFTPARETPSGTVTQGVGQMRVTRGQPAMENQMSSGSGSRGQVSHWAYMLRAKPGDAAWESLPGVGVSIPEFLGGCPEAPHVVPPSQ